MVQQGLVERFSFSEGEEDASIEILELGAIRKPMDMDSIIAEVYFFDGI